VTEIVKDLAIRQAGPTDVPALAALFADDALGGHGDTTDPAVLPDYEAALLQDEAEMIAPARIAVSSSLASCLI